jgi:hypothetical protein
MIMPWSFVLETQQTNYKAEKKVTHMSTTTSKAFVPLAVE